jgi:hypothetical protein
MFKIDIKLRFGLMALTFILYFVLQFTVGFGFAFIPLLVFIILTVGYFLFGTLSSSAEILNTGDFEAASKQLALTWKPEWLLKMYRGFYYQLKGFIALQMKNFEEGEQLLLQAKSMGLPSKTDYATIDLQLASIYFNKRNFQKATAHLREVKNSGVKEPIILDQVTQMEQAMKTRPNMGQMMAMQQMRGMRGKVMTKMQQPTAPIKKPNTNNTPRKKK